jgi:hypothetical protein
VNSRVRSYSCLLLLLLPEFICCRGQAQSTAWAIEGFYKQKVINAFARRACNALVLLSQQAPVRDSTVLALGDCLHTSSVCRDQCFDLYYISDIMQLSKTRTQN